MEQRLRQNVEIFENPLCFMPGRLTMEAIFSLMQLMEKYRAKRNNLHMVFVDLEKVYDMVPRDLIWWVLNKMNAPRGYTEIIKDIHEGVVMNVRITCGEFPVTIGCIKG